MNLFLLLKDVEEKTNNFEARCCLIFLLRAGELFHFVRNNIKLITKK